MATRLAPRAGVPVPLALIALTLPAGCLLGWLREVCFYSNCGLRLTLPGVVLLLMAAALLG